MLFLALATGCAKNPATGANQIMLVSEAQEIQMGAQYDSQVVATIGLYQDQAWQNYVDQLGHKLAANSERPSLPWTFRVVNDAAVNAFAVPGGHVYVTRGILSYLGSEAQLASVMGHEIGHVTARHTAQQITKQELAGLGLAIGSIASTQVAQYAGAAQQALGVLFLKFSRDDESQADQLGLRYMTRANYNPNEMPAIFTMLDRESKLNAPSGQLPEWLQTHPSPEHRLEDIKKQIASLPSAGGAGGTVDRDTYLQRVRGLVFGTDPREGYFDGTHFYHPQLRFQFNFPAGWKTQNGAQAVVAVSSQQDAGMELTQAPQKSADAAAQAFLASQGISSNGPSQGSVNGLRAVGSYFGASTQNGNVRGSVMWVEYGGAVYQVLGYAPETKWSGYQNDVQNSLRSFQPLNDPSKINVQPQHLDIITVPRRMTIAQLAAERSSPVSPELLAVLNEVEVDTPLESGRPIKWVTGTSLSFP